MRRWLSVLIVLLAMAWPAYAQPRADTGVFVAAPAPGYIDYCAANGVTCHYVLAGGGASGTTGADWAHACSDFSGSCAVSGLVRGDRYYVGTGNYSSRTFSTTESGTLILAIKGATVSDHGTGAGWSSAFSVSASDGGASAHWANGGSENVIISHSYVTFDGNVGSGNTLTNYGFVLDKPINCATASPQVGIDVSGSSSMTTVTVSHVGADGCSQGEAGSGLEFNTPQLCLNVGGSGTTNTNITFSHNYCKHWGVSMNMSNTHDSLIERNWFEKHFYSGGSSGKEPFALSCYPMAGPDGSGAALCGNNTVRYNMIRDAANPDGNSTACVALLGTDPAESDVMNGWFWYGNVFANCDTNRGAIGATNQGSMRNNVIVQNTFDTLVGHYLTQCEADCNIAGNNTVQNNLSYSSATGLETGTGGAYTHDHNSYCSSSDTPPTETGGQTSCGNLFVDRTNNNFHLSSDTSTRAALGAPYNVDADGVTITSSRGAFQYVP